MIRTLIKKNRRVLIAGAKFGEVYINAFLRPQPGLELAGLLARGSRRAQQLARDFGIPLYTSLDQVPGDIDIACVVVRSTIAQGEGSQLAEQLLQRGIHVVQEHPLHPDDVAKLQKFADERGLVYWVNSFYPHLSAGRSWVAHAARIRSLLDGDLPCSAQLTTSRQLLYSSLDLLLQACGVKDVNEVQVKVLDGADDCFAPLRLTLPGGCPVMLRLQSYLNPTDPDMFSLVMHQASLVWPSGYLSLEASHGPVVWTGSFHDQEHDSPDRTMYRYIDANSGYGQPPSLVLHQAPDTWRDAFEIEAAAGVAHVLQALCQILDGGANLPIAFSSDHQLALAQLWLTVLHCSPPVAERHLTTPKLITREQLHGIETYAEPAGGTHE